MKKLIIDKSLTEQALDWILDEKNREKYLPKTSETDDIRSINFWDEDFDKIRYIGFDVDAIKTIDEIILNHYKLDLDTPLDDEFGYMVSWQKEGKEVKPHRDANREGKINTRFNFLIKKPSKGGLPVIKDKTLKVKENEVWLCLAGLHKHGTTKIEVPEDRILISIGHYVNEEIAKEKGWLHPDCKAVEENPMWNRSSNYDEDKFYPYASKEQRAGLKNNTLSDVRTPEEYMSLLSEWFDNKFENEYERKVVGMKLGFIASSNIIDNEEHIS